jgi:hypothetical protein
MDEDGFLAITSRLSRFLQIGGETVPHIFLMATTYRPRPARAHTLDKLAG